MSAPAEFGLVRNVSCLRAVDARNLSKFEVDLPSFTTFVFPAASLIPKSEVHAYKSHRISTFNFHFLGAASCLDNFRVLASDPEGATQAPLVSVYNNSR